MVTIAFVHNRFPAGGAERITIDIARYLRSIGGYRVYVYATRVNQMLMTEELDEILTIRHIPSQAIQARRSAAVETETTSTTYGSSGSSAHSASRVTV